MSGESSIDRLAKLFMERNNPVNVGITTGKVISTSPVKVSWADQIILTESRLVLSNTISSVLAVDDEVIMIPNTDHSVWYLIDKVG